MSSNEQRKRANKPRVSDVRACAHSRHTTEHGYPDLSTEGKPSRDGRAESDLAIILWCPLKTWHSSVPGEAVTVWYISHSQCSRTVSVREKGGGEFVKGSSFMRGL